MRGSGLGVTYAVLGPLEATVDGRPARLGGPRARAVLAMLLLRAGQVVPAPALVDAVWGEHPPVSSANLLQGYVSDLRKELGRESIRTSDPGYRLTVAADAFDLRRFEKLAADGSAALTRGGLDEALARLGGALSLWRGPALADIIADHAVADGVVAACAARLEDMRLAVQERYAEALLATGDARQAAAELAHLIRTHPLREEPRALLMLALYRCGRQAEALEVFREGRSTLVAELGIEPGAALRDLEAAILRQDATLSLTAAPAATSPRAAANTNGSRTRTVLIGALDLRALPDLTAVARRLLQGTDQHELIIAGTVRDVAALHPSLLILEQYRT
ncbi:MAG TPA: AfsR/SARP family transcriptional regulator, partial [Nakamurella sp.]